MYNLLVVDDERFIRQGITRLINTERIEIQEIYEAENGKDALFIMTQHNVDIILADINMPLMNGLTFSKEVKRLYPACKIALITGYDYLDYAIQAIKIGVDDYILKPVSKDDIHALLVRMVEHLKKEEGLQELQHSVDIIKGTALKEASSTLKADMINMMEHHISDAAFTLAMLAHEIGYNISYLSSIFKPFFGMSFRDYMLEQRLEKAKILMLSTSMKNYEIAEAVGIKDANYFSTCFKKKYNITVTEYRNGVKPL